jgi:hypothetical protein
VKLPRHLVARLPPGRGVNPAALGAGVPDGGGKAALVVAMVNDWCDRRGVPKPETEHHFAPPRKWRFDMAWVTAMIAVEIQGGGWTGGRHTRGKGFENDAEKFSTAAVLGWRVLPVTYRQCHNGMLLGWLDEIRRVLA